MRIRPTPAWIRAMRRSRSVLVRALGVYLTYVAQPGTREFRAENNIW